ncbi:hypothetical protein [Shewanella marina]|uniref:hypothetical protein n=1 Tax=Shewanella marina TaxID=487319 RepID=UPI000472526D|nr:hypothetical protein [Shewanella marina]
MTTNKIDFSTLNKSTAKSFNDQKNLIKRLFKGQTVACEQCKQPLQLTLPANKNQLDNQHGIKCKKGCTDIQLEVDL